MEPIRILKSPRNPSVSNKNNKAIKTTKKSSAPVFNIAFSKIIWSLYPFQVIAISFQLHFQVLKPNLATSLVSQTVKSLPAMEETQVWSLGQEDPLEKEMATQSSILAWKIPWIEEPRGLQSMGLQRVGHDWATSTFFLSLGIWDFWPMK